MVVASGSAKATAGVCGCVSGLGVSFGAHPAVPAAIAAESANSVPHDSFLALLQFEWVGGMIFSPTSGGEHARSYIYGGAWGREPMVCGVCGV